MSQKDASTSKRPWVAPAVKDAGTVAEILQGGGGKLSTQAVDTGETRKPKGQG